jgi:hypothetical protein
LDGIGVTLGVRVKVGAALGNGDVVALGGGVGVLLGASVAVAEGVGVAVSVGNETTTLHPLLTITIRARSPSFHGIVFVITPVG